MKMKERSIEQQAKTVIAKVKRSKITFYGLLLCSLCLSGITSSYAQQADTVLKTPVTTAKTIRATNSITLDTGFVGDGANGLIEFEIVGPAIGNCVALTATPSANQNYVMTLIPRIPLENANTLASKLTCEVIQSIQYLDGLGRPLQTVQVKASPGGYDMVQPIAYDNLGRETTKYLPYTTGVGTPGSYRADALNDNYSLYTNSAQQRFYNPAGTAASVTQLGNGVAHITTPYAATSLESSPLGRPMEQGAPGDAWQLSGTLNPSGVASGHTVKMEYAVNNNTTYAAKQFSVNFETGGSRSLSNDGAYPAGQLHVTISKDENWTTGKNHSTEEYKDKEGHVVLKRTFNNGQWLSTYYVYDDLANLCYVLPPKAEADSSAINATVLGGLCYQYKYDNQHRLTAKKIPGSGWQYMVYNKLDQVTATQDSMQRAKNQWIITKYDALGRTVVTGIWNNSMDQATLQSNVEAQTIQWEAKDIAQTYGYTLTSTYPTTLNQILSVGYYDNYNIPNLPSAYDYQTIYSQMTRGLATATLTNVLNTSDMLWTVNYYDDKGRVIQTYAQHYLGGTANLSAANHDHITNTYDFTNAIINTTRQHYTSSSGTPSLKLTVADSLVYDHMGRKRQSWSNINNTAKILLTQNDYNELGQGLTRHLHSDNSGATYLQDISYAYNERGWMTKDSSSKFSMNLKYNSPGSGITQQYNGNIAQLFYKGDVSGSKAFAYSYDSLNRLTNAASTSNALDETISYDKMGNINALARTGASVANLIYTYATSSNQLTGVTNSGSSFRTYNYDGNGNATTDGKLSGAKSISYNMLNLPDTIRTGSTVAATYTYEANGIKVRNVGIDGAWDYIGGIVYHNGNIEFVQTEEGRAIPDGTSYSYQYNLKDHLGNTRVSLDKTGILQEDEYYSFGLRWNRRDVSNNNRYLYNGKEIQADLENQYDYGARFYDPVIGRWTSVDPLAEKFRRASPYNYGNNNPIRNIDPDGMAWQPDNNGNLLAEEGDNASTLSDYLKVDVSTAQGLISNLSNWNDGASMGTGIGSLAGNYLSANSSLGGGVSLMSQMAYANPDNPDGLRASGYDNGPVNMQDISLPSTSQQIGANVVNTYGAVSGAFELKAAISAFSTVKAAATAAEGTTNEIALTKSAFGHTFTTHGDEMTGFLLKRAEGSGMAQGQFLDNQAAARFINNNLGQLTNGAVDIPMPEGFPARVITPSGGVATPTHIRLVPSGAGVKTAYPLIQ